MNGIATKLCEAVFVLIPFKSGLYVTKKAGALESHIGVLIPFKSGLYVNHVATAIIELGIGLNPF